METKNFDASSIIIGFTGSIGSGSSLFAKNLCDSRGYKYYSLSTPIHRIADEQSKGKKTKALQDIGNELRKKHGLHYLAQEIIREIDKSCAESNIEKVVIDSIRNDKEVKFLRQFPNFFLVSVYAGVDTRFMRLYKEDKEYSRKAFEADDLRDATEIFPYGQQVERCNYESDIIVNNNKDIEVQNKVAREGYISKKLDGYLALIEGGPSASLRPKKEEKLITLAYMESLSSSCLQRKVGAVIATEDGEVISTGYNHVPPSEKTCLEQYGECYRNYLKKSHAERIEFCPQCGRKIEISCNHCGHKVGNYRASCPKCDCDIEFDYICPNKDCGTKVFEVFTPGGKQSIGKLLDVCRALHAEEHAILNLSKAGSISLTHKVLYSTTFPCKLCANKITQAGIRKVVFGEPYTMPEAHTILKNKQVQIDKFEGVKSTAFFRLFGT